jgi:SAM-dependent methyltransferase
MRVPLQHLADFPRRLAWLILYGSREIQRIAEHVRRDSKAGTKTAETTTVIAKRTARVDGHVASLTKDVRALATEVRLLRDNVDTLGKELRDRLLQYNLLLGRLASLPPSAAGSRDAGRDDATQLSARAVPISIDQKLTAPGWADVGNQPHPDPFGREWLSVDACPMCGDPQRTVVNEWNKLVTMGKAPDADSARYDYAICHACGVGYATRRPFGSRYRFLLAHFGEVTNKHDGAAEFTNPLLNPYPLTNADREVLARRAARGVFVSDHLGLRGTEYLDGLIKDRLDNSPHLDLIGALIAPRKARVLEVRPRTGVIAEGLRRLFDAEVHTMPIWESQQFLLKQVYGINSLGLVDYDDFRIPDSGPFDLIVCNHMLTHAVRPQRFFDEVRRTLKPGGHIYFYNEPDDAEFLSHNQSMFAALNPLHMQTFDLNSFVRCMAANDLDIQFHRRRQLNHISLVRRGPTTLKPMGGAERDRRIGAYRTARDRAILSLRGEVRARFAGEWPSSVARAVAEGVAEFDADGTLRLVGRQTSAQTT